jgi:FkbM family methyltransferase
MRNSKFSHKDSVAARLRFGERGAADEICEWDGVRFELDLSDDVQRLIYFNVYEQKDLEVVAKLLAAESGAPLVFDIGANIGFYSLQLVKRTAARVYAFEPEPDNFRRLQRNICLNKFETRITPFNIAVSNESGNITFYKSLKGHSGWGSLAKYDDIAASEIKVKAISLDDFCARHRIGEIGLLKIDVEGYEFEVLDGARHLLARQAAKYILIEFNGVRLTQRGHDFESFYNIFAANRYEPQILNLDLLANIQRGIAAADNVCVNFLFVAKRGESSES